MIVLDISVINWKKFQGPTRIFVVVFGHADAVYAWLHIVPKTSEIVQKQDQRYSKVPNNCGVQITV